MKVISLRNKSYGRHKLLNMRYRMMNVKLNIIFNKGRLAR